MPKGAPIKFTLYGDDDEIVGEYSRSFIPWKFLKRAIKLAKLLEKDENELTEEDVDALGQLVVDFYGERFTLDQFDNGADISEGVAVLQAIISRAAELSPKAPNPTQAG